MSAGVLSDLTVLVVDDQEPIREIICGILETFGVRKIRQAANGFDAYKDMLEQTPDAVITEFDMTPVDGLTFTRTVRTAPDSPDPEVPILMITGHRAKRQVEQARDAGVSEFLALPVTANAVAERLTSAVRRPRSFVRARNFIGPDRRRRQLPMVATARRRAVDWQQIELASSPQ